MMAAEDGSSFRPRDDASSIALLRGLRSGAADLSFVHRADVCSAAPADLVANLEPVPGTDLDQGGYNAIWLFYCPKRFKNAQGKPSGHRQRAIAGDGTCWHSEAGPKPVKGLDGATFCNLSFGRKEGGSTRAFNRMGWCMTEYDDKHGGGDGGDHVLCKIYRSSSSLAKGKSKLPTTQHSSGCKRKATGDEPQARPTKTSHKHAACAGVDEEEFLLTDQQMGMPPEPESLCPTEEEQFTFTMEELLGGPVYEEYGGCSPNTQFTMDEMFSKSSGSCSMPAADDQMEEPQEQVLEPLLNDDQMTMPVGIDYESLFPAEEEQDLVQQNTMVTAEVEQFQQDTLMSTAEEEQLQQNNLVTAEEQQLQLNPPFSMDGLLGGQVYHEYGSCSANTQFAMDELFSGYYGAPTAMAVAPPDVSFFEGLAF
ncbi:uncharacterized protein LOC120648950 [Panicum virgatum]|uniref:uncharacterized protein LOC120648950 n=1 Tax=Panicum virgatum TaxID=38727 RepID=UPI0019D66114|nr:uncharacterized protein LOC120648950 [Panicum virgatum]